MRHCLGETICWWTIETTTNVVCVIADGALGDAEWAATQTVQVAPSAALE